MKAIANTQWPLYFFSSYGSFVHKCVINQFGEHPHFSHELANYIYTKIQGSANDFAHAPWVVIFFLLPLLPLSFSFLFFYFFSLFLFFFSFLFLCFFPVPTFTLCLILFLLPLSFHCFSSFSFLSWFFLLIILCWDTI